MREPETLPLFQDLDDLFGFQKVFTRTHEMFTDSYMYLLYGSYLPSVKNGELVEEIAGWRGHLGGVEGLRQKGWTVWTVCIILEAAHDLPLKLGLMGQGDNQIMRESFPDMVSKTEALIIHYQFLKRFDRILSHIGPPLKPEETWTSFDLFVYGKYIIYKGAALCTASKRLARMFQFSNEDFPTLESSLSASQPMCHLRCPVLILLEYFT